MNLKRISFVTLAFVGMGVGFNSIVSHADTSALPSNSRIILGAKIKFPSGGTAALLGFGDVHYEGENFFIGGAAYTGQISSGGISGSYTEAGILGGYTYTYNSSMNIIGQALLGAGGGSSAGVAAAGFLVEPSIGVDIAAGHNLRIVPDIGYSYIPSTSTFSGFVFDVAIHFMN